MKNQFIKIKSWNWPVLSLLLLASILRFWDYFQLPYHHDELSALHRTFFSNITDLIEKGVETTDTHPPLVQVWLYYYTKLFGYEEWLVKLPFLVISIVGLFCLYRLTKRWTNNSVALIILALFAVSQYHLMHSQMIRMYIPGFFFTIQFIYYWSEIVLFQQKTRKNVILFVVYGILGALTHHFCLLAVLLTGIVGLFFVQKNFRWKYIAVCILIPFLYLPNLGVFLTQLKMGGIGGPDGWLAKPEPSFIWNYFFYVFNFSILLVALFVAFFWPKLLKPKSELLKLDLKISLFSLFLFSTTFFIAYFYSVYKNPVLQYSVLLFVAPFFFIGIFIFLRNQKPMFNAVSICIISLVGVYSLFTKTRYYDLFYTSGFQQVVLDSDAAKKENENTFCIIGVDYSKTLFYRRTNKMEISTAYFFLRSAKLLPPKAFEEKIYKLQHTYDRISYSIGASIPPQYLFIIQKYFPKKVVQKNYYLFTSYIFEKGTDNSSLVSDIFTSKKWGNCIDSLRNKTQIRVSAGTEWGPSYSNKLNSFTFHYQDGFKVSGTFKLSSFAQDIALVGTLMNGDSVVYYTSEQLSDRIINKADSSVSLSVYIPSTIDKSKENLVLNTYLWNRSKQEVFIQKFQVRKVKGNPVIYGLMEPK